MGKRSREKRSRRLEIPPPERAAAPRRVPARAPAVPIVPSGENLGPAALWLEHRTALIGLFALALLVRALLLFQIARTPFFEVADIDSVAYQQWAGRIAAGAWWPAGTFYQSPLYAYFLAVLYKVFGVGLWSPRIVQIVLGSVSPVLVYAIGTRLFSRRVGWIAGVGLALYGPIILEEITFSKTTLLLVTSLGGFALYLWAAPLGRTRAMATAGMLFGVSVVGVGQWLLPFLALVAWVPMMCERLPRDLRRRTTEVFAVGGLALILPLIVWNSVHGGGVVLTSGDAGLNLYNGNNERASGLPAPPPGVRDTPQYEEGDARGLAEQALGHHLTPAEVTRYWSGRALDWVMHHPGDWLVLVGQKFITLWNGFEIPDNYHYAFMRAHFLPLLRPLATFALVAPLALVGAAIPFWRRRDLTALYLACFGYMATMLIIYIRGRYRIPAVPFLMVLGAFGVDRVLAAVEARRWPAVATLTGGLVLAAIFTNHERCEPAHHGMAEACLGGDTWFDQEWLKVAEWYRNAGQLDRAIAYADRAREVAAPRSPGQIASWIAELETMRTEQLVQAGRRDEAAPHFGRAEEHYRTALRVGYRVASTQSNLGSLYAIYGKPGDAVAAFEGAQAAGGVDLSGMHRFALAYRDLGRCEDAERVLARLDRARGVAGRSDDTRAILTECRNAAH